MAGNSIRGYAVTRNARIVSVPLGNRPQGKTLLGRLKAGDVVITAKLDRMFRSALDALGVLADPRIEASACT